uniref:DNA-directed RNA polymerase III subunit RPC4 n=1 Tax=Anthurium amnicola TaxID=1678845 RepID=A0A1D1Y243_9ARAE
MGDKSSSSLPPRKLKFAPKIPSRKAPKLAAPKTETPEEAASHVLEHELLKRVKQAEQAPGRRAPKDERKAAPMEVAFGHQNSRTTYARSYGFPKPQQRHEDGVDGPTRNVEKEYVEPWNYYSYYPITLPLRRPYSGNPEILDEEEFGEASVDTQYDETSINPAEELGLMLEEDGGQPQMFFFQLPASLPVAKRSDAAADAEKGKEIDGGKGGDPEKRCSLEDLPAGLMGKIVVYRSGIIKMKLGDAFFDVTPGSNCMFAQDVMAINTQEKHCSLIGELNKRVIVTPDVETLFDSITKLD